MQFECVVCAMQCVLSALSFFFVLKSRGGRHQCMWPNHSILTMVTRSKLEERFSLLDVWKFPFANIHVHVVVDL